MKKIYIIFQLVCVYIIFVYCKRKTERSNKELTTDPGCLQTKGISIKTLNDGLALCQIPREKFPEANVDRYVEIKCELMGQILKCFRDKYEWLSKCLNNAAGHAFYTDQIKEYTASQNHLCKNDKKSFKEYLNKGEDCIKNKNVSLAECDKLIFDAKWVNLSQMSLPPEPETWATPKESFNYKECRSKGIWLMCVLGKLEETCKNITSKYYKGYYGSMLAASKCDPIIRKEFPLLAYKAVPPKRSSVTVNCRLDLYLFLIILSALVISM